MNEKIAAVKKFVEDEYMKILEDRAASCWEDRDVEKEFLDSEGFDLHLPESRVGFPISVVEAYDFYNKHCEGWGGSRLYRTQLEAEEIYIVRVTTDGDSGWVEVFDGEGQQLVAGRTYLELIAWGSVAENRSYGGEEFPKELDDRMTRTRWNQLS